ncbi:integrase domain-containing protein [Azonexus fungiphilus]|uniref:integrase domain-containing protein n=1 Tax=Azonexus fungiphilus TaxID=146940 RepID=UPI00156B640A|nr:integrase domain-containing protein [Azonexus fungiphilus]NHC07896.1 hypothetical protein [Azonexus fungiphilus]
MANSFAQGTLPKSVQDGVYRTIDPILNLRANGKGLCSRKTKDERRLFYPLMVAQLWELGYRIRKLESLAGKHVTALMQHWHKQGLSAGTLHTRRSMINYLCDSLGKKGVVKELTHYLPEDSVQRRTACVESKAWDAHNIDPLTVIDMAREIDERLAVMLAFQHFFGLRVKESIEIRPANAVVEGGTQLEIHEGTKGGRTRRVPIMTDDQRDIVNWARRVAVAGNSNRLRWVDCTWKQAQNRFYHLIRFRLGITRKLKGITAHGLRHGYAQGRYRQETGMPSPVEGGALGRIDRQSHHDASITVSRALGHGRIDVTASYYGSYGHQLRMPPGTNMTVTFTPIGKPSQQID